MLVTAIEARPLRSLDRVRVELEPGIVSVVGPNGVGKTNLVEALYFALTGRSFRTSDRRDLIPFGGSLARAEATVRDEDGLERRLLASVSRTEGRRHLLDGSPADPATLARNRPPVAVFAPDRLTPDQGPAGRAPRPPRRLPRRPLAGAGGAAQALRPGAGAAQRAALAAGGRLRRPRRSCDVWDAGAGRGRRAADRRPRRGGRRARRPLRRGRGRARPGGRREPRVRAARRGLGRGDPRRPRGAPRAGHPPRPQLLGPAPRRAEARRPAAARCAATAPRASSAPPCWPCSSPSARRC